jgi:hypothetical protein
MFGLLMSGAVPHGTALSVGERALSRTRSGIVHGQARPGLLRRVMSRLVEFGRGKFCPVLLAFGHHLHGRRGRGFDAARWLESCRDGFVLHGAMRVWVMRVLLWKPSSCGHGGRSTRPWWDVFLYRMAVSGQSIQVRSGHVYRNHTRAGTVPDRRGRCGVDCGLFCRGSVMLDRFGLVVAVRGKVRHVEEPSSCRHGAGSTPAAWGVLRQGPVGCHSLRSVWTRSGGAGQGCVRFGGAWNQNHHADGAVPASTLDGGMRLDVARLGKARRVESRPGVVTPPS